MRPIAEGSRCPMVVCSRSPAARPESARGRLQGRNHGVDQRVSALLLPCPRLRPWGRVRGIGPLLVREPGQSDRPRARVLGLRAVLQRLQTRHFLSQGLGKVAFIAKVTFREQPMDQIPQTTAGCCWTEPDKRTQAGPARTNRAPAWRRWLQAQPEGEARPR